MIYSDRQGAWGEDRFLDGFLKLHYFYLLGVLKNHLKINLIRKNVYCVQIIRTLNLCIAVVARLKYNFVLNVLSFILLIGDCR